MYNNLEVFKGHEKLVDEVIDFFLAEIINPEKFAEIRSICSQENNKMGGVPETGRIRGYLSVGDFCWYMSMTNRVGDGIKTKLVDILVKLLESNTIILRLDSVLERGICSPSYKANGERTKWLHDRGLIKNLIFGFEYIIKKYSYSVFKIEVKQKQHDHLNIGTGFFFRYSKIDGSPTSTVVTNKHVIENAQTFRVLTKDDETLPHKASYLDPVRDIAVIELAADIPRNTFHFYQEAKELSDVITIGYPSIPMTREAYQVYHKGEINSHVEDYGGQKFFLFSAKTSPGNSGSPIIDRHGLVVGMVTQEFFEEAEFKLKGKLPYYAGIPGSEIFDYFNNDYLMKVNSPK